jgi:hypothetical protein
MRARELRRKFVGGEFLQSLDNDKVVVAITGGAGGAGFCLPSWQSCALEEGGWGRQVTTMDFPHGGRNLGVARLSYLCDQLRFCCLLAGDVRRCRLLAGDV